MYRSRSATYITLDFLVLALASVANVDGFVSYNYVAKVGIGEKVDRFSKNNEGILALKIDREVVV